MSVEAASMVMMSFLAVESIIWLIGLTWLVQSRRRADPIPEAMTTAFFEEAALASCDRLQGAIELPGSPREIATRLKRAVNDPDKNPFYPLLIIQHQSDHELTLARSDAAPGHPLLQRTPQLSYHSLQEPTPQRTSIAYLLYTTPPRAWLLAGWVVQMLALAALVGGSLLIYHFFLSSDEPEMRVQVIQMVQIGHFLWPNFVVLGKVRWLRKQVAQGWESWLSHAAATSAGPPNHS